MIDTTIVITAYHSPEFLGRAVESAIDQTTKCKIIVANDGGFVFDDFSFDVKVIDTDRPDAPYLSWYDAIHRAETPYVAILHDDDWYEPTFIERTRAMMTDDTAYVFSEAMIHEEGNEPKSAKLTNGTRHVPSWEQRAILLNSIGVISPSCTLHRRDMLLRSLLPGGLPHVEPNGTTNGPDMLLTLIPLMYYSQVASVGDPLTNYTAHPKSVTTAAAASHKGACELYANYHNAKVFFRAVSLIASGVAVAIEDGENEKCMS